MAISQNEQPIILQVKNDVVRVSLPDLSNTTKTFLTASVPATGTTLTIRDATGWADNDLIVLGEIGQPLTENIEVNDASADVSLTVTACVYGHPIGTPVYETPFDQVSLYGASTLTGDKTIIGSAVSTDFAKGFNDIIATTQYDYYFAQYTNSESSETSAYSEGYTSSHPTASTRQGLKLAGLDLVNETIGSLITEDFLNREVNNCQREIQQAYDGKCSFAVATDSTQTLSEAVQTLTLPTTLYTDDYKYLISIRIEDGKELSYVNYARFKNEDRTVKTTLASDIATTDTTVTVTSDDSFLNAGKLVIDGDQIDYTSKDSNVFSGVTNITSTHSSGDVVYQHDDLSEPSSYTIYNGSLLMYPIPSDDQEGFQVHIDYYRKLPDLDSDNDVTLVPFYTIFQYYLASKIMYRKEKHAEGDRWMSMFMQKVRDEVARDTNLKDNTLEPKYYNSLY